MKPIYFVAIALLLLGGATAFAGELGVAPDAPFRTYTVRDGLIQKTVTGIAQDADGVLWVATFGGLNRFDGKTFDSVTTRQGLRQNLIQYLMVDQANRLWAGDAGGGLSVIEDGIVTRTYEPGPDGKGIVRDLIEVEQTLYIGMQPGGLRRLALNDPEAEIEAVPGAPQAIFYLVPRSPQEILLVGESRELFVYRPGHSQAFERIATGITALQGNGRGFIAVAHADGRVGALRGNEIDWFEGHYPGEITGLTFADDQLAWVFLERKGMSRFGQHEERDVVPVDWSISGFVDQEGLLWVSTRTGLARYLGERFKHYSLLIDDAQPEVFAIEPGRDGDFWFGTSIGLLRASGDGELTNVSDELGIDRREVREVRLAADNKTLYVMHVNGLVYAIDTETMAFRSLFDDDPRVLISMVIDQKGHLWAGSYYGQLYHYDPQDGSTRSYEIGDGAGIYAMDLAPDGVLWFAANYRGLHRLDASDETAQPEMVVPVEEIEREFFTHVYVESAGDEPVVWFSSLNGGVFRWDGSTARRVVDDPVLTDKTVFALQPLGDGSVVFSSSHGVYRLDWRSGRMDVYKELDGFVAVEGKVHAMHREPDGDLWIGTTSGVTRMDTTMPMRSPASPRTLITRKLADGELVPMAESGLTLVPRGRVQVEYTAISMLRPDEIEFSYRLDGRDSEWSAPTRTRLIEYSSLGPGRYEFQLRARYPSQVWSEPRHWAFEVPTPYYRTRWFIGICLLAAAGLTWLLIQMRLRSIARANRRLRQQVAERTESIDAQRRELESINQQLSCEIEERQKVDALRADVEQRFHQAYQNSPVGMALVDTDGLVYDANPALKNLFWPHAAQEDREPLLNVVSDRDREALSRFLDSFDADGKQASMEVDCIAHSGERRRIDFLPSPVRNEAGQLQYIVLLASDVTESRAMTRQLEYQAHFDELTGLVNRRAFAEKLSQTAQDFAGSAYLMFLDLDQFKVVNDTCGHAAGDELLRKVAQLIAGATREADTVARLGGDEFAVILTGCSQETALKRAEQIRESVAALEFLWDADVFRVGVSIGVVPVSDMSQDLNELQQIADAACYAAKDAGRNRVHLVSGQADTVHTRRGEMRWVQRLNLAIDTGSFELHGQRIAALSPVVQSQDRIEVLLRMKDHTNGRLIPPGAFLPAAERYGLQGRLDDWVVQRVIDLLVQQRTDGQLEHCCWVNLSGASVGDPAFCETLIGRVRDAALPPGTLNFEITETAVIRKIDDARRLIQALRDMGCRFALDDFGSGLSSFGYLKHLDVDGLKIDGQFLRDIARDPTDRIFVKSIIDIAHTLGMRVVTEFVEDDEILAMVTELGSDFAQGFAIHRPEPLSVLFRSAHDGLAQSQSA